MKKRTTLTALFLTGIIASSQAQTSRVQNNRCFADVNGDGKTDYIVMAGDQKKPVINVYLSNGRNFNTQPVFVSKPATKEPIVPSAIYFADVNGDHRADFVTLQGKTQTPFIVAYLATDQGYSEEHTLISPAFDKGYDGLPRGFADINGDGRADYLTFRGDFKRPHIVAYLATDEGFNEQSYKSSVLLEEAANNNVIRAFADVNADGLADYMDSYDGKYINIYPGTAIDFKYGFIYPRKTSRTDAINNGHMDMPRGFIDVDGDNRADYLTFRGHEKYPRIYIHYGYGSRFETTAEKSSPVERGMDNMIRGFADVNGDGKWDYVTFRGTKEHNKAIVYFSNGKDFIAPCEENTVISFYNDAAYNAYFTLQYELNGEEHMYRSPAVLTNQRIEYKVPAEAEHIKVVGYCNECYDTRRIFTDEIDRSDCPSSICYRVYGDLFKKSWDFNGCSNR